MSKSTETLAILFADIAGSTALYENLGDTKARELVSACTSILTREMAKYKGRLIKTIGDEIMCVFPTAEGAAQAACDMQSSLEKEKPGGDVAMYVRVGFHYGEVISENNDVFGDAVNVAARITAVSNSRSQRAFIEARAPTNLEVITADVRTLDPHWTTQTIAGIHGLGRGRTELRPAFGQRGVCAARRHRLCEKPLDHPSARRRYDGFGRPCFCAGGAAAAADAGDRLGEVGVLRHDPDRHVSGAARLHWKNYQNILRWI